VIARSSVWSSEEIVEATRARLVGDPRREPILGVATDTRDALAGKLFVALRGERFDAHEFLNEALKSGAAALLVGRSSPKSPRGEALALLGQKVAVFEVEDTLLALGDLAAAHRRRVGAPAHRPPVVGLTGSNGKTTTKEMIAAILASAAPGAVLKTEGNLNNQIGLPMTLLGLEAKHRVAVLEMGMNQSGEIAALTQIADPDVGLVTNVGPAHIGMLGSLEAIARAKGELFRGLSDAAERRTTAVINLDDDRVLSEADRAGIAADRRRTFGRAVKADVRLLAAEAHPNGEGQAVRIGLDGQELGLVLPFAGAHNALNACAAIAAATAPPLVAAGIAVHKEQVVDGLQNASQVARRLVSETLGSYTLVDDCYNANGASMLAAIETLRDRARSRGRRAVALLGEMRELGSFSSAEHARVGRAAAQAGFALVASFGPEARPIADEAAKGGAAAQHEDQDVDALYAWLAPRLRPGDLILVKGSRGIHMERFIERLRRELR
jgi:UDP-N-acetylmuramoyl-tripeptide--D-alanyl-D-alanine ligase